MCKRDWHLWKFQTRFSDRTVSPSISATDRHGVQCELVFKQLGSFWDTLSNSLHLYHVAFRNWRVCLSSPLQALSRVTPSGLQSAVPRWDHPHASRADQPQPWSALRLLQQPLTMWNQPPQIKSKQETSSFLSMQLNTLESRKLERWTDFGFLFFFLHTPHTLPYLHYSNRHLGTSVVLDNISFCQTIAGEMGGTCGGCDHWPSMPWALWHTLGGEGHPPAAQGPLSQSRASWLKPCTTALIARRTLSYCKKSLLHSLECSCTDSHWHFTYRNLLFYVQQRLNSFHTSYSLLQVNRFLFLLV